MFPKFKPSEITQSAHLSTRLWTSICPFGSTYVPISACLYPSITVSLYRYRPTQMSFIWLIQKSLTLSPMNFQVCKPFVVTCQTNSSSPNHLYLLIPEESSTNKRRNLEMFERIIVFKMKKGFTNRLTKMAHSFSCRRDFWGKSCLAFICIEDLSFCIWMTTTCCKIVFFWGGGTKWNAFDEKFVLFRDLFS